MTLAIKRATISSVIMIFITAFFILGLELYQRPDAEGLAKELVSLDGYAGGKFAAKLPPVYSELKNMGAKEVLVYTVPKTGLEFAVATFEAEAPKDAIDVFQNRIAELLAKAGDKKDLIKKLNDANIVLIGRYAVFTVYDTDNTAKNVVFQYFG